MRSTIALVTVEAEAGRVAAATEFQFHCRVESIALLAAAQPQVEQSASSVAGGFPLRLALRRLFTWNVRRL